MEDKQVQPPQSEPWDLDEVEVAVSDSATLARLVQEVKRADDTAPNAAAYNRQHNRHNR